MLLSCVLSSDEKKTLKQLVNAQKCGDSPCDLIEYWHETADSDPDSYDRYADCCGLAEAGYIAMSKVKTGKATELTIGGLTSLGRCYFDDKAAREAKESDRLERQRRHDYAIAAIGVLGGLFSGALGSLLVDAFTSDAVRFATSALWHIAMRSFWPF